jgi:hypothetical protein
MSSAPKSDTHVRDGRQSGPVRMKRAQISVRKLFAGVEGIAISRTARGAGPESLATRPSCGCLDLTAYAPDRADMSIALLVPILEDLRRRRPR